ncbi:hypothetical protein PRZ48_011150 [Zasmidium cellare]|uniref:F-box domain-containing protein n=1 Tax=Zasmidium cellare TaxID=395010 RepID=A0ABR0EAM0_ZASCE|nr:hypothetical protein PRZ48_011150 [Zasmidium cellare]
MTTSSSPSECYFLTRLPQEVRDIIYEHILTFSHPLKLRQVVAGSKNTSILRANRQIHSEALPVFYDTNTILATRNDFCVDTDADLQTPVRKDQVRHLLIKNFSQSIRCSSFSGGNNLYLSGCCDVCKPNASGFLAALNSLPRLKSVVIDYLNHYREFAFIKQTIQGIGSTHLEAEHGFTLTCTGVARYKLTSPSLRSDLDITFTDLPLNTIWTALTTFRGSNTSIHPLPGEEALLHRLREDVHRDLPDCLNTILVLRHSQCNTPVGGEEIWRAYEATPEDPNILAELTEAILGFTVIGISRRMEARLMVRQGRGSEVPVDLRDLD